MPLSLHPSCASAHTYTTHTHTPPSPVLLLLPETTGVYEWDSQAGSYKEEAQNRQGCSGSKSDFSLCWNNAHSHKPAPSRYTAANKYICKPTTSMARILGGVVKSMVLPIPLDGKRGAIPPNLARPRVATPFPMCTFVELRQDCGGRGIRFGRANQPV